MTTAPQTGSSLNPELRGLASFFVLLAKEFRRQRGILVAAMVFTALPYLLIALVLWHDQSAVLHRQLMDAVKMAMMISCVMAAFFGGHSMAGERPTRSLEFLAYLPVPRVLDVLTRFIVAAGLSTLIMATHLTFGMIAVELDLGLIAGLWCWGTLMACLSAAWFFSAWSQSSVISAAGGVLVTLIPFVILMVAELLISSQFEFWMTSVMVPCLVGFIAVLGLIGGTLTYFRRNPLE